MSAASRDHSTDHNVSKAIYAKQLIDGTGAPSVSDAVVVVEGQTIVDVGFEGEVRVPPSAETIYLPDNETLLPGLVDSHNHPSLCWYLRDYLLLMEDPEQTLFLRALRNFRINLLSGVTTIRCLSEKEFVDLLYRMAVEEGLVLGPRIRTCTRGLRSERGHGFLGTPVSGIKELRQAMHENVEAGADFLKFFVTGTVLVDGIMPCFMTESEIQAAVDTSHELGKLATVHAVGGEGLHRCLDAGVDCVEHGYFVDDEALAKLEATGRWLVITSGIFFDDEALRNLHSRELREALVSQRPLVRDSLSRAVASGVNITVGTDGLVGKLAAEIRFLVCMGMSPLNAIRAATLQGARLLGLEQEIGSIQKGKRADLISVVGDPIKNVSALEEVRLVMKNGWRIDQALRQSEANYEGVPIQRRVFG